jgi:hypothetical protein
MNAKRKDRVEFVPAARPGTVLGRRRLPPAANDNQPGFARIARWAGFAMFLIAFGIFALKSGV